MLGNSQNHHDQLSQSYHTTHGLTHSSSWAQFGSLSQSSLHKRGDSLGSNPPPNDNPLSTILSQMPVFGNSHKDPSHWYNQHNMTTTLPFEANQSILNLSQLSHLYTVLLVVRRYLRQGGCDHCNKRLLELLEWQKSLKQMGVIVVIVFSEPKDEGDDFFECRWHGNPDMADMLRVSDETYRCTKQILALQGPISQLNHTMDSEEDFVEGSKTLVPKMFLLRNDRIISSWENEHEKGIVSDILSTIVLKLPWYTMTTDDMSSEEPSNLNNPNNNGTPSPLTPRTSLGSFSSHSPNKLSPSTQSQQIILPAGMSPSRTASLLNRRSARLNAPLSPRYSTSPGKVFDEVERTGAVEKQGSDQLMTISEGDSRPLVDNSDIGTLRNHESLNTVLSTFNSKLTFDTSVIAGGGLTSPTTTPIKQSSNRLLKVSSSGCMSVSPGKTSLSHAGSCLSDEPSLYHSPLSLIHEPTSHSSFYSATSSDFLESTTTSTIGTTSPKHTSETLLQKRRISLFRKLKGRGPPLAIEQVALEQQRLEKEMQVRKPVLKSNQSSVRKNIFSICFGRDSESEANPTRMKPLISENSVYQLGEMHQVMHDDMRRQYFKVFALKEFNAEVLLFWEDCKLFYKKIVAELRRQYTAKVNLTESNTMQCVQALLEMEERIFKMAEYIGEKYLFDPESVYCLNTSNKMKDLVKQRMSIKGIEFVETAENIFDDVISEVTKTLLPDMFFRFLMSSEYIEMKRVLDQTNQNNFL